MERRTLPGAAAVLAAGFIVMQLVPVRKAEAAGPEEPIEASLPVPADVKQLLDQACANCHSAHTEYPWYARVAPVSWLVSHDTAEARKSMDLSHWGATSGRTTGRAIGTLMAACAGMQTGAMPPAPYRMMHPEARLSSIQVADFCAWTSATARELRAVASR